MVKILIDVNSNRFNEEIAAVYFFPDAVAVREALLSFTWSCGPQEQPGVSEVRSELLRWNQED